MRRLVTWLAGILLVIVALAVLLLIGVRASSWFTVRDILARVQRQIEEPQVQWDEVMAALDRAARLAPGTSRVERVRQAAYQRRAEQAVLVKDWQQVIADVTWLLDRGAAPTARLYDLRARAYDRTAQRGLAIDDLTRAITLAPRWSFYWRRLECRVRQVDENAANAVGEGQAPPPWDPAVVTAILEDYRLALASQPPHDRVAGLRNSRGWFLVRLGEYRRAVDELDEVIHMMALPEYLDSRAWAWFHLDELDRAEADARAALVMDSSYDWEHFLLLRLQATRGDRAGALAQMRRLARGTRDEETRLGLAYCLGDTPLGTLMQSDSWGDLDVAIRGFTPDTDAARAMRPVAPAE